MYPILESHRLLLRGLKPEDARGFYDWKLDPWIADNGLSVGFPYPEGAAERFIERSFTGPDKNQYTWGMVLKEKDLFVGIISLFVTPAHHHAQIGYWIGKEYRNQGITTEAGRILLSDSFMRHNLNRIFAQTFTHNPASVRVLEKLGMKYEATLRKHVLHDTGVYRDLHIYGLLRSEL